MTTTTLKINPLFEQLKDKILTVPDSSFEWTNTVFLLIKLTQTEIQIPYSPPKKHLLSKFFSKIFEDYYLNIWVNNPYLSQHDTKIPHNLTKKEQKELCLLANQRFHIIKEKREQEYKTFLEKSNNEEKKKKLELLEYDLK